MKVEALSPVIDLADDDVIVVGRYVEGQFSAFKLTGVMLRRFISQAWQFPDPHDVNIVNNANVDQQIALSYNTTVVQLLGTGSILQLPIAYARMRLTVINRTGADILVQPQANAVVETNAAGEAVTVPDGTTTTFLYVGGGQWLAY